LNGGNQSSTSLGSSSLADAGRCRRLFIQKYLHA
jgi:hypothetical protein